MTVKDLPLVPGAKPGTMAEKAAMEKIREERPLIDYEKCNLCRQCLLFCPDVALTVKNNKLELNLKFCRGCRICAVECPEGAITMVPEFTFDRGLVQKEG